MDRVRRRLRTIIARQPGWTAALAAALALAAMAIPELLPRAVVVLASGAILVRYAMLAERHSTRSSRALDSLVAMSTDLARAGDASTVGDRMAAHLARAVKVDQCGICYWDETSGQVLTLGYFPAERRDPIGNAYLLSDYPECQRALVEQRAVVLDRADAGLPAPEREYIESIGGQVLAVVPLVVAGRSTGLVELTAERDTVFDAERLRLARTMATEAAIMLENARLVEELRHRAFHDPLTGLPNRALFRDRVSHALERSGREPDARCAVHFIDVDDFKQVNDRLGHDQGDDVLRTIADRLQAGLRRGDTAARLGGDEFTVLIEDAGSIEEVRATANRLALALGRPIRDGAGDEPVVVGVSTGIAMSPEGGLTVDDLLTNADAAMYLAKAAGKGRSAVYEAGMRVGSVERQATDLPEGLVRRARRGVA
jgi:diguanylate cyclase (GGDEF)-like protein